ncbi:MAG: hypothetical protein ACYC6Y_16460 [Thermoguttaceae bacterium]
MRHRALAGLLILSVLFAATGPVGLAAESDAEAIIESLGLHGGLCVQVGGADVDGAGQLAASGRYLVQVLDADRQVVDEARKTLQSTGLYGLISADQITEQGKLPYTENLVNLVFVTSTPSAQVPPAEIFRVLCPGGIVVVGAEKASREQLEVAGFASVEPKGDSGEWWVARKPRPRAMDEWTHPRHAADGNPVSGDTLVAPPRRVRWVAGAQSEVRGMVTASGRNYYAGVLTRDSFNGLRLWHHDIVSPGKADFVMKNLRSAAGSS